MGHWRLGRLVVMPLPIRPFLLILLIDATRMTQARRSADAIAHRQALGFIEIKTMCLKTLSGGAILRWSCLAASATMHDGPPYNPCIFLSKARVQQDHRPSQGCVGRAPMKL